MEVFAFQTFGHMRPSYGLRERSACFCSAQLDRFCHVVASLPHEVMRACANLVETTPAEDPYTQLKERLLASHQLMPFQRGEKLLDLPMLGAVKPSELMHQMLELFPKGDETTTIFQCLFLHRLPADLRVMRRIWIIRI